MPIDVIDMPTIDDEAIVEAHASGRPVFVVDQNNGYLWANVRKVLFDAGSPIQTANLHPLNLTGGGPPQYVHSGTYAELASHFGLDAEGLTRTIEQTLT